MQSEGFNWKYRSSSRSILGNGDVPFFSFFTIPLSFPLYIKIIRDGYRCRRSCPWFSVLFESTRGYGPISSTGLYYTAWNGLPDIDHWRWTFQNDNAAVHVTILNNQKKLIPDSNKIARCFQIITKGMTLNRWRGNMVCKEKYFEPVPLLKLKNALRKPENRKSEAIHF